jgi:superfamily II DNA or RNA helicase
MTYKQQIGTAYEYYVVEELKKDYDKVWHWRDFPEKLMYENNLIEDYDKFCLYRYDIGVDVVALKNNVYYFIQCKNFHGKIFMHDLAGFFAFISQFQVNGIVCYNGIMSQRVLDLITRIKYINIPFNNQKIDILNDVDKKIKPRDYQLEAKNKLDNKEIAILSLPCGLGKTYISSLLGKEYNNIVILSPTRYLAQQTLEHFKVYTNNKYEPILISMDGNRDYDDIKILLKKYNVISSTYDSADVTFKIMKELEYMYIIVDEFHNLSENNMNNKNDNMYKIINYDQHRLFMSATPLKKFMNIPKSNIYSYSWENGINNKYIHDFNIIIPDKNEELLKFAEFIIDNCDKKLNEIIICKAYFILRALLYNGNKKCICYMTTIEKANEMSNIIARLAKLFNIELQHWIMTCDTKRTIRNDIIKNFKKCESLAIIINVHILDEGIDIKECDSAFITQPSYNIINIVQRMCRANRICVGKNKCNVYLWCGEKKTEYILDYLYESTNGYIKNKVSIFNTQNKLTNNKKEIIEDEKKYTTNNEEILNIASEFIKKNIRNKIFKYNGQSINVLLDGNNTIYFRAKDITNILEYSDNKQTLRTHIEKEDKIIIDQMNFGKFERPKEFQTHLFLLMNLDYVPWFLVVKNVKKNRF